MYAGSFVIDIFSGSYNYYDLYSATVSQLEIVFTSDLSITDSGFYATFRVTNTFFSPFSATSRDVKRVSVLIFKHLILKSGISLTRPCLIGVFESNYRIQITCEDFIFF